MLNHFKKYEETVKKDKDIYTIVTEFNDILNDMWCKYSYDSGCKKWRNIARFLDEPFRSNIATEMGHTQIGYGVKQARLALKDEIEKYIVFLIEKYCQ